MTRRDAAARERVRFGLMLLGAAAVLPLLVVLTTIREWAVPLLIVLGFAAVSVAAVRWISDTSDLPPPAPPQRSAYSPPAVHDEAIGRLRRNLVHSTRSPAGFDRDVRPHLTRLADDRLRAAFGITITTHPDAARARLGEELWQRLASTSEHPPTEAELRRMVAALGRITPPG